MIQNKSNNINLSIENQSTSSDSSSDDDEEKKQPSIYSPVSMFDQINTICSFNSYHIKIIFSQVFFLLYYGLASNLLNYVNILYSQYYNYSLVQMAWLINAYYFGTTIGAFSVPFQYQIIKARTAMMRINLLLSIIFLFIFVYSDSYVVSIIFRVLLGVTIGFLQPLYNNLISEVLPLTLKNFIMVSLNGATIFGTLLIFIVEAILDPDLKYIYVIEIMLILAILGLTFLIVSSILMEDSVKSLVSSSKLKEAYMVLERITTKSHIKSSQYHEAIVSGIKQEYALRQSGAQYFALFQDPYLFQSLVNISLLMGYYYINNGLTVILPFISTVATDSGTSTNSVLANEFSIVFFELISPFIAGMLSEFSAIGINFSLLIGHFLLGVFSVLAIADSENMVGYSSVIKAVSTYNSCIIYAIIAMTYPINIKDKSTSFVYVLGKATIIASIFINLGILSESFAANFCIFAAIAFWNFAVLILNQTRLKSSGKIRKNE